MSRKLRNYLLLALTAIIWGSSFVAQVVNEAGPFTYNFIRFLMASAVLLPVIRVLDMAAPKEERASEDKKTLIKGGVLCGIVLCVASNLQQIGILLGASAGKAGFLTACYIIMVPILGLFIGRKCGPRIWVGVVLTLIGLYLLCIKSGFSIEPMDGFEIACAVVFAVHILTIDRFSPRVNGVKMACMQFFVAGLLSAIPMLVYDMRDIAAWAEPLTHISAWYPIMYGGIMSGGVGYTLQIVGQKGVNPTVASLIMSMESVFSVLTGFIVLGEVLSWRELAGCALIFAAVILATVPRGFFKGFNLVKEQKYG